MTPDEKPFCDSVRGLIVAATLASFLLLLLLVFLWFASNYRIFPRVEPRPFDQTLWKAWTIEDMEQSENIRRALTRRDMLNDLLVNHDFIGWKEEELTSLLGRSNPEFCPLEWDVAYLIGSDWIDYVVLVFRLDNAGKVEAYEEVMF